MRSLVTLAAAAVLIVLSACSTTQYIIGTKTGQLIVAHGEPELDKNTNMYRYRDADGKEMSIAATEVAQIVER